jgi:hypothetical protein
MRRNKTPILFIILMLLLFALFSHSQNDRIDFSSRCGTGAGIGCAARAWISEQTFGR